MGCLLFSRQLNYISNSLCFIGTVSLGLLWCLYVELRSCCCLCNDKIAVIPTNLIFTSQTIQYFLIEMYKPILSNRLLLDLADKMFLT